MIAKRLRTQRKLGKSGYHGVVPRRPLVPREEPLRNPSSPLEAAHSFPSVLSKAANDEGHASSTLPHYKLVSVLNFRSRVEVSAIIVLWAACFLYFWTWWFRPEHNIGTAAYFAVTALQFWITLLPAYCVVIFFRARRPAGRLSLPDGARVAMIVTKTPSEPFAVVKETLVAMLAQEHPHDTWLADEDPSEETIAWCAVHGVRISTRRGNDSYHRAEWPRRTRCKEGNLAYFYDNYGYKDYAFVVQLDADHVPQPGYLIEMLKPFSDPAVGYVSAPSICGKNAAASWSARSRLHFEATMHGALQAGYNGGWAPMCIGSHYAVRTAALRQIGGLGPELAEDHSTTLFFQSHGWRGAHALDAIASGDGPATFADLATQEFQWSRSLTMILLNYTPALLRRLPGKLKFQFLFSQFWYPIFAMFMLTSYLLPIVALLLKAPLVGVSYPAFLLHSVPLASVLLLLVAVLKREKLLRPVDAPIASWEFLVFFFAKWPWVLLGTLAALHDTIRKTRVEFRVTPKGTSEADPVPIRTVLPYFILSMGSALPVVAVSDAGFGSGFYILALFNAVIYGAIFVLVLIKHDSENKAHSMAGYFRPLMLVCMLTMTVSSTAGVLVNGLRGLDSITYGMPFFAVTERMYPVAGAGQGGRGTWSVRFHPRFITSEAD